MNLVTRFLAARRDKLLMRLGCWLVCFSLVLGLMFPYQRTKALAAELTMAAVASAAAAYLGACGLEFITKNMDKDALVSSVQRLIQEFLDTELGGISIQDWLGNVWDLTVVAGKIFLGRPLTEEFLSFAQWVAGKFGTQVGFNPVYSFDGDYFFLADGSKFFLSKVNASGEILSLGTVISKLNSPFVFSTGYYFSFEKYKGSDALNFFNPDGSVSFGQYGNQKAKLFIAFVGENYWVYRDEYGTSAWRSWVLVEISSLTDNLISENSAFGVDREEDLVYVPPGIEAGQGIALDVGAAETMNPDLVLQGVLDDVITGDLISTMEAAGEIVVDPPVEEEITDVDNLGLPALGQALTSRFPFSIPWDFFRAVQLLAAPPKAPYFEVDFMAPLADDVGGWKGDTTVVLDFSEYAIIGQISRWTSTIGFCLMLAGTTKRLIWTA